MRRRCCCRRIGFYLRHEEEEEDFEDDDFENEEDFEDDDIDDELDEEVEHDSSVAVVETDDRLLSFALFNNNFFLCLISGDKGIIVLIEECW